MPPHSAGPGQHTYTLHIYALSAVPQFAEADGEVTREVLLTRIKDTILDSADLQVTYVRPPGAEGEGNGGRGGKRGSGQGQRGGRGGGGQRGQNTGKQN